MKQKVRPLCAKPDGKYTTFETSDGKIIFSAVAFNPARATKDLWREHLKRVFWNMGGRV